MTGAIITFEGYALYEWGRGYKSLINDEWITFDSAAQWVQYIKRIKYGK
jgi:hypothetical protein